MDQNIPAVSIVIPVFNVGKIHWEMYGFVDFPDIA